MQQPTKAETRCEQGCKGDGTRGQPGGHRGASTWLGQQRDTCLSRGGHLAGIAICAWWGIAQTMSHGQWQPPRTRARSAIEWPQKARGCCDGEGKGRDEHPAIQLAPGWSQWHQSGPGGTRLVPVAPGRAQRHPGHPSSRAAPLSLSHSLERRPRFFC